MPQIGFVETAPKVLELGKIVLDLMKAGSLLSILEQTQTEPKPEPFTRTKVKTSTDEDRKRVLSLEAATQTVDDVCNDSLFVNLALTKEVLTNIYNAINSRSAENWLAPIAQEISKRMRKEVLSQDKARTSSIKRRWTRKP